MVVVSSFSLVSNVHATQKSPVLVGLDASYSIKNSTSATAIELGVRAAVHEINDSGGVLGGRPIKLVTKDNRSVPDRGLVNLKAFAATEDMVAVFGGRFSPVLLQQVSLTHELKLPLLDVWAAADGITDH
ncbi:MAG: branched-chain amino acid transport system substrate-binding protein, partial [Gammaproteobacteria bacterium]